MVNYLIQKLKVLKKNLKMPPAGFFYKKVFNIKKKKGHDLNHSLAECYLFPVQVDTTSEPEIQI